MYRENDDLEENFNHTVPCCYKKIFGFNFDLTKFLFFMFSLGLMK